jgi:zinc transport system ATP-binding protein
MWGIKTKKDLAISIRNLTAGYDGEAIIKDIDLEIRHGDFFGLIGPNGGGKSTLLKAILGLLKPMRGTIRIYGEPVEKGRRFIGYVPQYTTFDKDFPITVMNVVMMGRRRMKGLKPLYSGKDRKAAQKALEEVGMWEFRKKHINQLSGGQKQRVYIARALSMNPKLLLLDEPTASIDARMEESIYRLLRDINEERTIILVTHDIGVISSNVDTVACMNRHIFVNDGPELTPEMLEESYQCPVDLIAHGMPHRVLPEHDMEH